MNNLGVYLEKYALLTLEKQMKLELLIGEHTSEFDLEAGKIIFHEKGEFPVQVLGTESDNTVTWLWSWADEHTETPEDLLRSSLQLREWGGQEGIAEFTRPSLDLNRTDGRICSLIGAEICEASCYYRVDYEGGSTYVLLFGDAINRMPPFDSASLIRQFTDLISAYDLNHRKALLAYLRAKRLQFSENGPIITGEFLSGEQFMAEFDERGNMMSFNGQERQMNTLEN